MCEYVIIHVNIDFDFGRAAASARNRIGFFVGGKKVTFREI